MQFLLFIFIFILIVLVVGVMFIINTFLRAYRFFHFNSKKSMPKKSQKEEKKQKIFNKEDGDYIDFEEL